MNQENYQNREDIDLGNLNKVEGIIANSSERIDFSDLAGFHGASIEALEYLLKHGVLPGHTDAIDHRTSMHSGDIRIAPLVTNFTDKFADFLPQKAEVTPKEMTDVEADVSSARRTAEGYAKDNALRRGFAACLGLPADNQEVVDLIMNRLVDTPERVSEFYDANPAMYSFFENSDKKSIVAALESALERRGVLFGVSIDALYDLESYDPNEDGDLGFKTGSKGFPLKYIAYVKLLGEPEEKMFQEWLSQRDNY